MKRKGFLAAAVVFTLALTACGGSAGSGAGGSAAGGGGSAAITDVEYHSVEAIKGRGELHVATEATFAPYAFKDADGKIIGLEADLMQALADEMGVTLVIDDMAFDSVLPSVQSGLDDIAFAALTPTEERMKAFSYTDPYHFGGQVAVVRAEDAEKYASETSMMTAEVTMGAQKGSYQQQVTDAYYPDTTKRYLESVPNVITDLKAGNIDVAVIDFDVASGYVLANPDLALTFRIEMLEGDEGSDCGMCMLGNDDLTAYVNELIAKWTKDGSLEAWYKSALQKQAELGGLTE